MARPRTLLLAALAACSDPPPLPAEGRVPGWDGALLVLTDADMAATAYADGALYPTGAEDALLTVAPSEGRVIGEAPIPSTVMGWPGSMAASADGRHVYVVTSRGTPPPGTQRYDSVYTGLPSADLLTAFDRTQGEGVTQAVCSRPLSVDVAPSGAFLLVACGDDGGELAAIPLDDRGLPGTPRVFDLDVSPPEGREGDAGASFAAIHPSGRAAGVVLKNRAVALVRFSLDAGGVPTSAAAEAPTPAPGRWLSVARWARAGDHLLVADVGWGPGRLDAALNGDGAILSYALSAEDPSRGVVSEARVSKSPEGFAISPGGDLLAAVNMERTYLPGGVTALLRGRDASSVSLVAVGEDGTLTSLGGPVPFRGVLPEDAAFDADADRLAVAVYQDHDAPRSDGWIAYFAVEGQGDARRLRPLDARTPLPRGAHDLQPVD